jgi:hypothetical protein
MNPTNAPSQYPHIPVLPYGDWGDPGEQESISQVDGVNDSCYRVARDGVGPLAIMDWRTGSLHLNLNGWADAVG